MVKILNKDKILCYGCTPPTALQFEPSDILFDAQAEAHYIICPECGARLKIDGIAPQSWIHASKLMLENPDDSPSFKIEGSHHGRWGYKKDKEI